MNVPSAAWQYSFLRICCALLVMLLLPAIAATQQPMPPPGGSGTGDHVHAITGPNQKIGVQPGHLAFATLDGTNSYDTNAEFLAFTWRDFGGNIIATTPTVQVVLAYVGSFTYVLTVCNPDQQPNCNSVGTIVEVVQDLTPPVVDAPDITVSVTEPGSATVSKSPSLSGYMLSGATTSAVDDVDPHPHFLRVEMNSTPVTSSTTFPEGDTPVVVFYADQAGNVGNSSATVHVVDRQDNDLYIQNGVGDCFGTPCNDVIQRIRGGVVTDFCTLPGGNTSMPGIIMDSSGRAISLRDYGGFGVELLRCSVTGAPPEQFAWFQGRGGLPPGYPEPFPGMIFRGGSSISLSRQREVVIDDKQNHGNPFVVNEDAYLLNLVVPGATQDSNRPVLYHVTRNLWENAPDLGPMLSQVNIGANGASIFFHSGVTYAARGACVDRIKNPLSIQASGSAGGVGFNLQLNLFSSNGEICSWVLDNASGPHVTIPPCTGPAPTDGSSALYSMDSFRDVLYDDYNGYGLTLFSNSGSTGSDGVLTNFSELPFKDPSNPANFFQNPFFGCATLNKVSYDAGIGPPKAGGFWVPDSVVSTPNGLLGAFSPGGFVSPIQTGGSPSNGIVQGIGVIGGITYWPPNVSAGLTLSVLIRIDSPVDVLVTDPSGKKLGVQNGAPVNDFGNDGADTGAGTHPRFYAINNPLPGDYTVQSVGTGTGPYTVHVYSVDTSKPFGQHILSSGTAAPGALSNQDFTMDAGGGIALTNHPPVANAGPDQTVTAAANGTAVVALDGSASSDPDGDSLNFSWAGPFGLVNGAQPQVAMPVGVQVLQLTVDDGKGGTASANVTITVNPSPPPTCASDVSGTVTVVRSGYSYSVISKRYAQTITLTNAGGVVISGPISLVLDNLSSNATLFNAGGTTSCAAPAASPYVTIAGPLSPGASASAVVQFTDPTKTGITYTTRVLAGSASR